MPVIKSAQKKLRQDKKKQIKNRKQKEQLRNLLKKVHSQPAASSFQKVTSMIDKAAKTGLLHKNKASRMKSRLAKLATRTPEKRSSLKKPTKKGK